MRQYQDFSADDQKFAIGNQPRKSVMRKNKKERAFNEFERELDELNKHRHSYQLAADKSFTRAQLRADHL